jgi:uncharacterized protein (TIGR03089 family)
MTAAGRLTAAETPADLLRAALVADPARPVLTYRDESSGERTELSVATLENWVAKTANLLQEGLDAEPGTRVTIALPAHWQHLVWLLGCWSVGAVVVDDAATADVVVTTVDDAAGIDAPEVVALALRLLAAPGSGVPAGVLDYDVEVRGYGDQFVPWQPVTAAGAALEHAGDVRTAGQLVAAARAAAEDGGLDSGDRVLVTDAPAVEELAILCLAPLAVGAATLLVRPAPGHGEEELTSIATTEQVTHGWDGHALQLRPRN